METNDFDFITTKRERRMVFVNGCFDILHRGHVEFLNAAKKFGDTLVVAINDDESVRMLKGADRPINTANDRLYMLSNLECVDYVIVFHGLNCSQIIFDIRPDICVKSENYKGKLDPKEHDALLRVKAMIRYVPLKEGYSTTNIINKIKNGTFY